MKKYISFVCNKCNKISSQENNPNHFTPDVCTTTVGCDGRLTPLNTHSERVTTIHNGASQVKLSNIGVINPDLVNRVHTVHHYDDGVSLITGVKGQIVLGVQVIDGVTPPDEIEILFHAVDDEPTTFSSYLYRFSTSFSVIVGKESGMAGKNLRYNNTVYPTDKVEVRLNGVVIQQGTGPGEYQIYNGTNDVIPNGIKFNDVITPSGITQVDVIVSKQTERRQIPINFRLQKDFIDSRSGTGAYENVEKIIRHTDVGDVEYILYCADLESTGIPLNTVFVPAEKQSEMRVDFTNSLFLLANKPYSHLERELTLVVDWDNLKLNGGNTIKYTQERHLKRNSLSTSIESITPVYPPLSVKTFAFDKPLNRSIGDDEQTILDNELIIGPKP